MKVVTHVAENTALETIVSGRTIGVDVPRIERELAQLWKDAAQVKGDDAEHAVMRACVANLVIFAGDHGESSPTLNATTERVSDIVAEVVARHPCRVILVTTSGAASGEPIKAWISARCQMPRDGKRICCEQINLTVASAAMAEIPGVVLPLLAPEVPVYCWWTSGIDFDLPLFDQLAENIDHLLFDSAFMTGPREDFRRLWEEINLRGDSIAFRDLNWDRLTPWRQLAAQFFDSLEPQFFLPGIDRVLLESGSDVRSVCQQGTLLAGWIATRLGWEFVATEQTDERMTFRFRNAKEAVIEITTGKGTESGLVAMQLHSCRDDREATFAIRRADDGISAITTQQMGDGDSMTRRVRMRVRTEGRLVSDELDVTGRDRVYEASLAMAVRMLNDQSPER